MANRELGEVSVDIAGTSYTLCLDLNAMCEIEDMFSTPQRQVTFQEVLERVQHNSMRHIRGVLWATFRKHHPNLTLMDVAELAQRSGGILAFAAHLATLAQNAVPMTSDVEALGIASNGNPHKAQTRSAAGTGRRSTPKPA